MKSVSSLKSLWWLVCGFLLLVGCSDDALTNNPESAAEAQNLDGAVLATLVEQVEAGTFGEIHSLLIQRNGVLVVEEYFGPYTAEVRHAQYSVTKSVTSALVGAALASGRIKSLEDTLMVLLPVYEFADNRNAWKDAITLEHLLTMQAGFVWDEWTTPYGSATNDLSRLYQSTDWMKYMLDLQMLGPPGTRFVYNTGCTMLLSSILETKTGQKPTAYAESRLFNPLGIDDYTWETGPGGFVNTGAGLHLRPQDMVKIGQLYLNKGWWEGAPVLPESWVNTSTARHTNTSLDYDYGYQWWRFADRSTTAQAVSTNDLFFAWGHGGQFIFVIPHLNMVVTTTAGNSENSTRAFTMLRRVLGAVLDA